MAEEQKFGRVRSLTAEWTMVDYMEKNGTIATVAARQYPDVNVAAKVGEAVLL